MEWTIDYTGNISTCKVNRKLGDTTNLDSIVVPGTERIYEDNRIGDEPSYTYTVSCQTDEGETPDSNSIRVVPVKVITAP